MEVCVSEHRKVFVIRIKLVNFRDNISAFRRDKRNCTLYTGVRIKRVSIERTGGGEAPLYLQGETAIPNYT